MFILLVTAGWIGRGVIRLSHLQMDMDEAVHANRGLDFTTGVLNLDPDALWEDVTKPEWYPPGHGLLLGIWMLLTGVSIETVRLYSTLFYFLLGIVLWFSARELIPGANPLIYLLPGLFLVADAQFTVQSGLAMLEMPAVTFAFAGLFFFIRAHRTQRLIDHFLGITFAVLCLFTKYNYGIIALVVIVFGYGLNFWQKRNKRLSGRQMLIVIFLVMVFAVLFVWFIGLGHYRWLSAYAGAQPEQFDLWSLANLLYYPRLLWRMSLNWLAVLLSIGGVIWMIGHRRYRNGLTPYLLFLLLSLLMLIIVQQNNPRFGMMLFPPLWITAAVSAHLIISEIRLQWLHRTAVLVLIGVTFMAGIFNFKNFMSRLYLAYENANPGVDQAYDFIADTLDLPGSEPLNVVMFGRTDQWNGQALRFHLVSRCLQVSRVCNIRVTDTWEINKGWPTQEFTSKEQGQRKLDALNSASDIVHVYNQPESEKGWVMLAEDRFTFERHRRKPQTLWVSIYERPADE